MLSAKPESGIASRNAKTRPTEAVLSFANPCRLARISSEFRTRLFFMQTLESIFRDPTAQTVVYHDCKP